MIKSILSCIFVFVLTTTGWNQKIPKGGYHSPLKIPLILSSNFGELRPNHFHMGIDFKTNNKIGYSLYAIEEGFVSRIKVSPYGYGKVVYIDHPNGVTSVYAHCSEFKGQVDSIVRRVQLKEQNYAVEVFPKPNEIKLKRGEIFALSGNTGSSTAPHVHFEIRDTKTEAALNPLVFGFDIADSKKPELRGLKIYALTKDGYTFPGKSVERTVKKGTYGYYIGADKVTVPSNFCSATGGIGIAIDAIDRLDGAGNQCGLYGSILIVSGDTLFGQKTDRVPFESTRYVNSHKDFVEYSVNRKKYHKCFKTTENDLPIYQYEENGIIRCNPGDNMKIKYIAFDPKGNESILEFVLAVSAGEKNPKDGLGIDLTYLQPAYPLLLENDNRSIELGVATTYEPLKMDDTKMDHSIGKASIPVHKAYRVKIKSEAENDGKHYIEFVTAKGRTKTMVANYQDGWYSAETKYFGTYELKRDVTPPTISTLNFNSSTTFTSAKKMTWKIGDAHIGIGDYDIYIDGKWYLLEYEYKGSYVTFNRPAEVVGKKKVLLRVQDKLGNVKEWERVITFK
ncbi:MAG: murein DD-endopeptidase MepM/ murein hydrolase activator NlpD [Flavobacteriaceae bacterium]|jgi:murein DD-endopeptidase MepM/ murein hydrolase activator NlpD